MNNQPITSIRTREGRLVPYDPGRIEAAIEQAADSAGVSDNEIAAGLARLVISRLEREFAGETPGVEEIQDLVEETLISEGRSELAREYIIYRRRHADVRAAKRFLGVEDDLKLPLNALTVLKKRYLGRDEQGHVNETPGQLFKRVAGVIAAEEDKYGGDSGEAARLFYEAMVALEFLPNSPTLMNAGSELGLLSACFVLPVPDSIPGIFESVKNMAIIHQAGGGTGFSFSHLRPQGDLVGTTKGIASGPVSFMRAFDCATDVVKQGGRRRGANMGVLRADHPDILDFIGCKQGESALSNFNISVAADDAFMQAALDGGDYELVNPRTGAGAGRVRAASVLDAIASAAWQSGDPGMIFLDRINASNPTPKLGRMETTNPCGEQPLLDYESCNLGSIDVSKLVSGGGIDWERLGELVDLGVRFLDDVIDANRFPLPQIEEITLGNRKIGLGIMGFAETLIKLGVRYDSERGLETARELMGFISGRAVAASAELARQRGSFPNFEGSTWQQQGHERMRNATVTTIAPTGTISVIAGTTSGIEPLFAISFVRDVMEGVRLLETSPEFERAAREGGFYSEQLMMEIAHLGGVRGNAAIPTEVRNIFATALDMDADWHIRMQAAFQEQVDNAVSKTVNLPHDAGIDDVRRAFVLAWELGCKGITVFRYGSRRQQVLYLSDSALGDENHHVLAGAEYAGGCPAVDCEI